MNSVIFLLILSVLLGLSVVQFKAWHGRRRAMKFFLAKRREALERADEQERQKKKFIPKASNDGKLWGNVYRDKNMKVLRVTPKQLSILGQDEEFLSNKSNSYRNVKGLYRGQKVMMKLPSRKGMKYGRRNKKST